VSLDRFLVKVAQKEKESTDSSDSVSDNISHPTQYLINSITLCILNLNNKSVKRYICILYSFLYEYFFSFGTNHLSFHYFLWGNSL
jgi:hypothetical protein